jgi:hypothetical protein
LLPANPKTGNLITSHKSLIYGTMEPLAVITYIIIVVAIVLLINLGFRLHLKKIFKSHGIDLDGKPDNKEDKKEEGKS